MGLFIVYLPPGDPGVSGSDSVSGEGEDPTEVTVVSETDLNTSESNPQDVSEKTESQQESPIITSSETAHNTAILEGQEEQSSKRPTDGQTSEEPTTKKQKSDDTESQVVGTPIETETSSRKKEAVPSSLGEKTDEIISKPASPAPKMSPEQVDGEKEGAGEEAESEAVDSLDFV